jgi:flagellin
MSLGVLNNLNAISAQNNLNNTSNSLSKVLNQLSSGSKINSGADDAAGLSLVNGLQANSQALTQSKTNASEGVGLLTVADGALSQVTSLLNRAVTLATEASNGTLNSSQDTAANQEYQSILSEVSNIGSTTTYNGTAVFGSTTSIYTGDSSTAGASVNSLNIRSLSSSNVGDSNGVMSYSSGTNNVFIDLSSAGKNAAATDSLGAATATTTIAVNYITSGANGSAVNASANISVGAGTSFANTAQGLMSAINGAGLGLTASFGTATQAGSAAASAASAGNVSGGASTDTGIIISGVGVGSGTNGAGEIGTLTETNPGSLLTAGTMTLTDTSGKSHTLTLGQGNSTDSLANLAATVNAGGYGITATVNTTGYLNGHAANSTITFTSASSTAGVSVANVTTAAGTAALTGTPTVQGTTSSNTIGNITTNAANATYLASATLNIGSNTGIVLGTAGTTDNATNLAATINKGNYGVTASVNTAGTVLSFTSANANDTFSVTGTNVAGSSTNNAANQNQIGAIGFTAAGGGTDLQTAGETITVNGVAIATTTASTKLTDLAAQINAATSSTGVSATTNAAAQTYQGVSYAANALLTLTSTNSATHGATMTSTVADLTTAGTNTIQDTTAVGNSNYYSVGISTTTTGISDTSTGASTLTNVAPVADNNGSGGIATTSYSDAAGVSLANTDLSTQADAQAALTALNKAVTAVSAQDGYIGAQINQLNAVSEVLSTQSSNVTAAQNAVQATDYASATSNMSKYEILSQTGISALAQANSVQQEVTKLLQ